MAEAIGLMLLGLANGALLVLAVQARAQRRVDRLVRLFSPYHGNVGVGPTSAPSDVVVGGAAGWRHV